MRSLEKAAFGKGMVFGFWGHWTPKADVAQAQVRCGLRLSKAAGKGNGAIVVLNKGISLEPKGSRVKIRED